MKGNKWNSWAYRNPVAEMATLQYIDPLVPVFQQQIFRKHQKNRIFMDFHHVGNSRKKNLQKLRDGTRIKGCAVCFSNWFPLFFFRISPMGARSTFHIVVCACYLESRMDKVEKAGRNFLYIILFCRMNLKTSFWVPYTTTPPPQTKLICSGFPWKQNIENTNQVHFLFWDGAWKWVSVVFLQHLKIVSPWECPSTFK